MEANKLKLMFECPVCLMIPRKKKVFNCSNGHKICEPCYDKIKLVGGVKECPQGRCSYDKQPRRNIDVEDMVLNCTLEMPCRGSDSGCNVELKEDALVNHEVKCEFRVVPCPVTTCSKDVMFKDLESHLVSVTHNNLYKLGLLSIDPIFVFKEEQIQSLVLNWPLFDYNEAATGKQLYPQLVKRNGLWYFWVKIKADPVEAVKWRFSASVGSGGIRREGDSISCSRPVHPIDLSVNQILETGHYMLLDNKAVGKFKLTSKAVCEQSGKFYEKLSINCQISHAYLIVQ